MKNQVNVSLSKETKCQSDQISHSVMSDSLWPHESQYAMPQNHTYLYREVAQSCPTLCNPYQAPPSMGFSRQEYRNGLPFPSPGDLPNPGIKPWSPALWSDALLSEPPGNPIVGKWSSESNSPIVFHFISLIPKMSMFTLAISCLTTSNLPGFMEHSRFPCNIVLYRICLTSITSHIHNWALFSLWLNLFILSGVISPLFSSSI